MSGSNPFAFTGFNVPQLPSSSEASLRAELAKSKQNVTMLQREVQTLKDANGIAQALASAKIQVQEAQRESKRAQIAERIAREALASLNNTRKHEEEARNMSQESHLLQREVEELKVQLADRERKLETCQGNLAQDETRFYAELEEADTAKKQLQEELRDVNDRLTKANEENLQLKEEVDEAGEELKELRKDNPRLEKHLDDLKKLVAELNNNNDNLIADLVQEQAQRKILARERDGFETQLAETVLDLKERVESEAEANSKLALLNANAERDTSTLNEQMESLQVEFDTFRQQVDDRELERTVAIQNERIAYLERENEVLEDRLQEMDVHRPVNNYAVRPPTYRSVSNVSHTSMADELGLPPNAEFDDYESAYAHSDVEEPAEEVFDLELSGVREIGSIAPYNAPTPSMSMAISDAASTTPQPQHRNSFRMEFFPVSNVYSIEPTQPTDPTLSIYGETIISFSPSGPVAPELSLYEETLECISPIEPRLPTLAHSGIREALDYAPVVPAISTSASTAEPQRLSSHVAESLNLAPIQPTLPAHVPMNNPDRHDSIITSEPSNNLRRRHSPLDPLPGLRQRPGTNGLDDLLRTWPLADGMQGEPTSSQNAPPPRPRVQYVFVRSQGFSSFMHYLLHAIFLLFCLYCWKVKTRLHAWEHANGVGFGEGHGNVHDRYGSPYGNGHYLLGMLPHNLLSADSLLPEKAVVIITSTVSALENWVGLGPTPMC